MPGRARMREVFFLETPSGPRLALHRPGRPDRAPLLVLPPFAEELNKSRRQLACLGDALQAAGHGMLLLDLYGTGDSPGDFGDAALADWQADVHAARDWLQRRYDAPVAALALRAGLLLADAAACTRLAAWAPVTSGELWLNGLLRLRTMASRLAGGNETAASLLQQAADSGHLEVAGYTLSHSLITELKAARMKNVSAGDLLLLDVGTPAEAPPPALAPLLAGEGRRQWQRLEGSSFWQSIETETHPGLITATVQWLASPHSP